MVLTNFKIFFRDFKRPTNYEFAATNLELKIYQCVFLACMQEPIGLHCGGCSRAPHPM